MSQIVLKSNSAFIKLKGLSINQIYFMKYN